MIKYYKRVLSTFLLIVLIISMGACSKDKKMISTNETDQVAQQIADQYKAFELPQINKGNPITIKVNLDALMPTLSETPTAEQPEVFNSTQILKKAFELIYPNVKVEWARTVDTSSGENFLQYMNVQLASKTAPDITFAWGSSFASHNWFYDYNEILDKPNPFIAGSKSWREQFPDYLFSSWTLTDAKDRVLAIPLTLAPGTATALYYNKDIFSSLKIDPPKTWEDLFSDSKILADKGYVSFSPWGGPGSGNRKVSTNIWDVQFSLGPFYAEKQKELFDYNNDGNQSQSEVFRAAYEGHYLVGSNDYAQDLWNQVKRKYKECLQEGFENSDYESKWVLGKVGLLEDGLWRFPSELSNTDRKFSFGVIPPPAIDKNSSKFVNDLQFTEKGPYHPTSGQTFNIVMPSVEAHGGEGCLEACIAFLQFLTVPENNEMIILEGKGKSIGFQKSQKIPPELNDYFSQPFPKVPNYFWPGGFTNAGNESMSRILESWVKDQISDNEFYEKFDSEFKKDIIEYAQELDIDTKGWTRGW